MLAICRKIQVSVCWLCGSNSSFKEPPNTYRYRT